MVKGNERRVVILKGDKETPYEMACIFMKEGERADTSDIIRDAQLIIEKAFSSGEEETKTDENQKGRKRRLFFPGVIVGVVTSFIIYALIVFGFGYGL